MGVLKPAAIFSDHMVLQKGKPIAVWGVGEENEVVTVTVRKSVSADAAPATDGATATTDATANDICTVSTTIFENSWSLTLPPFPFYGGPYEMTVSDSCRSITYNDIYVGEVWLAGGQSNMELELKNCATGTKELAKIKENAKDVRFYYTPKVAYMDSYFLAREQASHWETCDSDEVGMWSAVGYYCGKRLAKELGCKVGIIGCNWGGTSASARMSKERLAADVDTRTYLEEYDSAMAGKSFGDYLADLEWYHRWAAQWQPKIDEFYREHPEGPWEAAQAYAGQSLWPEPLGPISPFRACGVYETMLGRVCPYTLAGFLYYQGESDDHKPQMYAKLLSKMIGQWRDDWGDQSLPFLLVQLPMYIEPNMEDTKHWCLIREAQRKVSQTVAHTGMAVILDQGEFGNIHPTAKEPVGERLALQALSKVYGKVTDVEANGPLFAYAYPSNMAVAAGDFSSDDVGENQPKQEGLTVVFDYADCMYVVDGAGEKRWSGPVEGFEIADQHGIFGKAQAVLREDGTVFVWSEDVTRPVHVRFQWVNYGPVTLFGCNDIPAAPFRSSEFERFLVEYPKYEAPTTD